MRYQAPPCPNRRRSLGIQTAIAVIAFALLPHAKATVSALGTLAETATSASFNTYALTLQNTSTAGNALETFWFAWVPGQDYLDTEPLSVQTPTGWTDSITGGGVSNGYAIEFTTTIPADAVAVGNTLTGFGFTSTDSLAQMKANSNFYPSTPVTTSEVTTGANDGGSSSSSFVVAVVPEPAPMALIGAAGVVLLCSRRRRRG
jgi:hypothetical protein